MTKKLYYYLERIKGYYVQYFKTINLTDGKCSFTTEPTSGKKRMTSSLSTFLRE